MKTIERFTCDNCDRQFNLRFAPSPVILGRLGRQNYVHLEVPSHLNPIESGDKDYGFCCWTCMKQWIELELETLEHSGDREGDTHGIQP